MSGYSWHSLRPCCTGWKACATHNIATRKHTPIQHKLAAGLLALGAGQVLLASQERSNQLSQPEVRAAVSAAGRRWTDKPDTAALRIVPTDPAGASLQHDVVLDAHPSGAT